MADPSQSPPLSTHYLSQDSSGQIIAATTIILILATSLFSLRLYARSLTKAGWGWDDFLLPPSWILLVGSCVTAYLLVREGGAGRHVQAVVIANPTTLVTRGKVLFALSYLTAYSNTFSRVSVVALYLRIFTTKMTRVSSWLIMAYLVGFVTAQTIAGFLECKPISYFWDLTVPGATGTCFNQFLFYKMSGILNIVGDVVIMVLPVQTIATLQTSRVRKIGIAGVFLSGSVGIIASCLRTDSFFGGEKLSQTDPTWADVSLISWTIVESGMYLSAACLVGLRPLLSVLPSWLMKHVTHNASRKSGRHATITGEDRDSISRIIKSVDNRLELRSFNQDVEQGIENPFQDRGIRVDSDICVTIGGERNQQDSYV